MPVSAQILAAIAAAAHVLFFYLESIAFTRNPGVAKTFGSTSPEETQILKGIFLNQGFYNLFLAIGVVWGLIASARYSPIDELKSIVGPGSTGAGMPDVGPAEFAKSIAAGNWGQSVVVFGLACMVGAAVVLLVSSEGAMLRGALIQGAAPAVALVILALT